MFFRRLWNFIVQLVFLPISLFINIFVLAPFFWLPMSFDSNGLPDNSIVITIIGSIICFSLGIFLSKLFSKIKGRKTDEHWETEDWFVNERTTEIYYGDEKLGEVKSTSAPYLGTVHHHDLTGWGWFSVITSFIAFPLRLIAFLMSFVALFVRSIYSTYKKLPEDTYYNKANVILHALFDFVISPVAFIKGDSSAKGLFFLPLYLIVFVISNFSNLYFSIFSIEQTNNGFLVFINLVMTLLFIFSSLILLIKNSVAICKDFSIKNGILIGVKYLLINLIPTYIALIGLLVISLIIR